MVAPVPAQISNLRPHLPVRARRSSLPLLTAHHQLPTLLLLRSQRSLRCAFSRLRAINPFPSYHIPATPAVSYDYALFCATARRHPSYFQWLPHSFDRHGGVPPPQRSFQDLAASVPLCLDGKSHVLRNLQPPCRLFALFSALVPFVFNRLQPLLPKHPGGGYRAVPNAPTFRRSDFQTNSANSVPCHRSEKTGGRGQ